MVFRDVRGELLVERGRVVIDLFCEGMELFGERSYSLGCSLGNQSFLLQETGE